MAAPGWNTRTTGYSGLPGSVTGEREAAGIRGWWPGLPVCINACQRPAREEEVSTLNCISNLRD